MHLLKAYSWEIRDDFCAVKTADKTLILEGVTGIPLDIVHFFTGHPLDEGEVRVFEFVLFGTIFECELARKQGRHRLYLNALRQMFIDYKVSINDLFFFEKVCEKSHRFLISILNQYNEVLSSPYLIKNIGENRAGYTTYRVGQHIFREQVQFAFNYRCGLSGVEDIRPSILVASHIKPWAESNNLEKVDRYNGLLLSPHYDKLFDKGLISFDDKGKVILSDKISSDVVSEWRLEKKTLCTVHPKTIEYLNYHRDIFGF